VSKLHGKQIKSSSIDLGKLSGSGIVTFESSAEINFLTGARLFYADAPSVDAELVNKKYVDDQVFQASEGAVYTAGDGLLLSSSQFSLNPSSAGDGISYTSGVYNLDLNSDALEIQTGSLALKDSIDGDRTFTGSVDIGTDLTVAGNLNVNGTTTFINTTELEVTDNIITLASGNVAGSGVDSGLRVDRGTDPESMLFWDESGDNWVAGLTGSELAILTDVGTGLSRTGNVVSLDSSSLATTLAGDGLTNTGSVLDVGAGEGITVNANDVALSSSVAGNGLTFTSGVVDVELSSNSLQFNGNALELADVVSKGMSFSSAVDFTSNVQFSGNLDSTGTSTFGVLRTTQAPLVNNDVVNLEYLNGEISTINQSITDIENGLIDEVIAGDGLSGGGTDGNVTLAVNVGNGLEIASDNVQVELDTLSGLELSATGIKASVDGTSIKINGSGQLEVDNAFLNAEPVYELTTLATTYANNDSVTTIALGSTPSTFSRVEVLVNGQKQKLGDGVSTQDAYFVSPGQTSTPLNLDSLSSGDLLVWNGLNAGFELDTGDDVEIIYEA
jgi:hypothetical protein